MSQAWERGAPTCSPGAPSHSLPCQALSGPSFASSGCAAQLAQAQCLNVLQMEKILLCKTRILQPLHKPAAPRPSVLAPQSTLRPYVLAQARLEWHSLETSSSDPQPVQMEPVGLDAGGGLGRAVKQIIFGL